MSKKKPPKEFVPMYSPNLVVGYSWMHYTLAAVSEAFMQGAKK